MSEDRVQRYLKTHNGSELLKANPIDAYGIWMVKGEDPNPDIGGHHHEPMLGVFEGTLGDVISYAVELDRFWEWGAGGSISKLKVTHITHDSVTYLRDRRLRKAQLEAELERIKDQINAL